MKKLLAILLVAVLALALVACGTEPETTTSSTAADTNTTPDTSSSVADTSSTEDPSGEVEPEDPPLFSEGIDIMNGDYEYMAVEPFWYDGTWPCQFEDGHIQLDFNWALVFKMQETMEGVYEQLIHTDDTLPAGTPNDQTWIVNDEYKWVVIIDEEEFEIKRFSILNDVVSGYIRMDLGSEYQPHEEMHEYDIVLKIFNAESGALEFWAWFTDPDLGGLLEWEKPAPIVMIPDENVDENTEALPAGSLTGISGAAGFNASETYVNLFDGMVRTKLCTNDVTTPIIFTLSDDIVNPAIKSISLVGANDDDRYSSRLVTNFKVYGAASGGEDAAWDLLCEVNLSEEEIGTITNYGERNYEFTKESNYRFYKLEIEHATDMYQISDIILYGVKGSVGE